MYGRNVTSIQWPCGGIENIVMPHGVKQGYPLLLSFHGYSTPLCRWKLWDETETTKMPDVCNSAMESQSRLLEQNSILNTWVPVLARRESL